MKRIELQDELRLLETEHARLREIAVRVAGFCPLGHENKLCDGCDQRLISECADVVTNTLTALRSFANAHFEHEERIMKAACRPVELETRFGDHIRDHAAFIAELSRLAEESSAAPPHANIEDLAGLTSRWLKMHFEKFDHAMIEFVSAVREPGRRYQPSAPARPAKVSAPA
jgi:hemerythrin-like metal-binding protein